MRNILFYLFLLLTFVIGLVFLSQGSYNEYLYQDVELRVPDSKYFIVPQGCLDVETEKGCTSFPYDIYGNKIIN